MLEVVVRVGVTVGRMQRLAGMLVIVGAVRVFVTVAVLVLMRVRMHVRMRVVQITMPVPVFVLMRVLVRVLVRMGVFVRLLRIRGVVGHRVGSAGKAGAHHNAQAPRAARRSYPARAGIHSPL